MPADYDGDNKADAAVFRPAAGTWFILQSGGGGTLITPFGTAGDQPFGSRLRQRRTARYCHRSNNGGTKEWWIQCSTAGLFATVFGVATDQTVQGDYTGDGRTDAAVWRPSTGQWFILRSEDFSYLAFPFGQSGDVPVPGDYDGDARFDAGVFRPSQATWYLNRSNAGVHVQAFGASTDRPVPSAYNR
ncbi:MAG TPA: VCBS repeat-containing protein [Pyrinomonadaceae bacterium]|nr:VCBS repeat-containing protein [Pyrinomonadaceae bacterium]